MTDAQLSIKNKPAIRFCRNPQKQGAIAIKAVLYCLLFFLCQPVAHAQSVITLSEDKPEVPLSTSYSYYVDSFQSVSSTQIVSRNFIQAKGNIPVFKLNINKVWLQFSVFNQTSSNECFLDLEYTNLSKIILYKSENGKLVKVQEQGNSLPLTETNNLTPDFVFPLALPVHTQQTYFLEVSSIHPIVLPAYISMKNEVVKADIRLTTIISLYCGIILTMLFYNLFLFISVKDKNYFIYSVYTFSLLLSQLTVAGYAYKYLWPHYALINDYALVCATNFTLIAGTIYSYNFLQIKSYFPKLKIIFTGNIYCCIADIALSLSGFSSLSYTILNYISVISCCIGLFSAFAVARKGFSPAYLYLVAWSSLLLSLVILVLRNLSVIPYTNFTAFIIYTGSAIETVLLSFALANKISVLRNEKETSQAEALMMLQQNEQLVREQNTILEMKIGERTYELKEANGDLEKTLRELKDAQIQLVESEKMASLGQLTAGIAHEINNPINFVKSNVSPLQMDVQDLFELITEYQKLHNTGAEAQPDMLKKIRVLENKLDPDFLKEEIESLIGGIEEGAERTAEIVRGLRSFSRLDESECKEVNVYENINSTLVLLRNNMPHYIKIRKYFDARAEIECYPGKLNQVFMNILTNSIHAINAKPVKNGEEYIDISTEEVGDYMQIRIADTGIGMTEEVKHKIFEPFFTTKDVGEGTGLGMAIVFKIIEKHNGRISVQSSPSEGAAFTIEIPYLLRSETALTENEITETEEADL